MINHSVFLPRKLYNVRDVWSGNGFCPTDRNKTLCLRNLAELIQVEVVATPVVNPGPLNVKFK